MADKKTKGSKPTQIQEGYEHAKPPASRQEPKEQRGYEHIQQPTPARKPDKPFTGGAEHITPPKPPPKKPSGGSGGGDKK